VARGPDVAQTCSKVNKQENPHGMKNAKKEAKILPLEASFVVWTSIVFFYFPTQL
jgi:hypothetical protein